AAKKDSFKVIETILAEQRPEAAYFFAENGCRTALLVINMGDASQIPAIAEPWFLAFNAAIDVVPVMVPQDLQLAGPSIAEAVKTYG
ncbi:MAG: hypothetical protein JOY53_17510, partial [Acidobacteriaceae bacterium]|nr:hypothetical protein [Acidobacteriaceae bacterium]